MQKLSNLFDGWIKFFLTAFIVLIPLYPKFPFFKIFGSSVPIRLEDFLILIIAVMTFVKIIPQYQKYFKNKLTNAIILFLFIGFISLLSAIFVTQSVIPIVGFLHLFRRIEYFIPILAVIAFQNVLTKDTIRYFIKVLMVVVLVSFTYGVGQKYFHFPFIITQNVEYSKGVALYYSAGSHINSTFAGHYDLATFLVLVLPIFIAFFFLSKNIIQKILTSIVIICGLWLLGVSASRISIVSYIVASSVSLILVKKYKEIFLVLLSGLIILFSFSNLHSRFLRIIDVILEVKAQEQTEIFEDRSTSIRLAVEWPRAVRSLSKNPLLGTGYSSMGLATDNDYLRLLGEVGLLGFFAFAIVFARIFKFLNDGYLNLKKYDVLDKVIFVGVAGGVFGVLINAIFIDVFEASKFALIFWFLIGLVYILGQKYTNVQKN